MYKFSHYGDLAPMIFAPSVNPFYICSEMSYVILIFLNMRLHILRSLKD